jgi:hypothetical protein
VRIPLAVCLLCATASDARADWLLSAVTGQSHTSSNMLTVSAPATTANIGPVDYRGEGFTSPIYYGLRGGWASTQSAFGIEAEWVHAKARATTRSEILPRFDQSHGLNFVLASLVYRHPVGDGRMALSARGGGGFTLPHVEGTFEGNHTESYQYGGLAWHAGVGLEVRIWRGLSAIADGRLTRTSEELTVAGASVDGTFQTTHVDFGVGWRFGR